MVALVVDQLQQRRCSPQQALRLSSRELDSPRAHVEPVRLRALVRAQRAREVGIGVHCQGEGQTRPNLGTEGQRLQSLG